MPRTTRSFHLLGSLFVLFLGASLLTFISFSQSPDQELHWSRTLPSRLSQDRLDRNLSSTTRWPEWFFSLAKVETIGGPTLGKSEIQNGSILNLKIDPKKGKRKQFDLSVEVANYIPGRELTLRVLKDSSGRLNKLFDLLEWKIELLPREGGSYVRATAKAHTCHWRSRLFGRLAEKIVMNQIFYPNLLKFVELRQPFSSGLEAGEYLAPSTAD